MTALNRLSSATATSHGYGRPHLAHRSRQGVLIGDTDERIRSLLGMFFSQQRVPFWLVKSGQEAVEIYQEHGNDIGLVLLDVHMRGWDGPLTFSFLQRINPEVGCYFMSDDFAPYDENQLLEMGHVGLVVKPFLVKVLAEIVQQCLANR